MKLYEYQGKDLFQKYGIDVPSNEIVFPGTMSTKLAFPIFLKSQVLSGDRMKKGGVLRLENVQNFYSTAKTLFGTRIDGELPQKLLAEEAISSVAEYYVSISYSTRTRTPALALSPLGGSGIRVAHVTPLLLSEELSPTRMREILTEAKLPVTDDLLRVISKLWNMFREEGVLLAEINPLFLTETGRVVAGDAKVITDDVLSGMAERPYISLGGDIAVIASGGGASMLNIDILMRAGGKPANYVEYSGNPPASVVEELTKKVLAQEGLRGVWVVGGTANFTDIYETMSGFVAGLRSVLPKPAYPIVIRRDGPNQAEAKTMLEKVAREEGYNIHVYGAETSMAESVKKLVDLMKLS